MNTGEQRPDGAAADQTVVRRPRAADRLLPKAAPPANDGVVVQRNVLRSQVSRRAETSRKRRIAGDLPDWEPLPPGELFVKRQGH